MSFYYNTKVQQIIDISKFIFMTNKTHISVQSKQREEHAFKAGDLVINARFNNIGIIIGLSRCNLRVILLNSNKITPSVWQKQCTRPWKGTITISNE